MRQVAMFVLVAVLAAGMAQAQDAAPVTVETMPPSVVKTVPQSGDTAVDPSLKLVKVTFSKDMMTDRMWAWCMQSPETFPEVDGSGVKYLDDKRTCVLPVTLKPGKTYVIWVNTQQNNAFRDTKDNPAVPYLLVFKTRDG